jgi:lysophospholipase L1-like esterase
MRARGRLLSCLVTVVIALAGFVTAGALPAAATPSTIQYVALGDSYAAGQGAPPYNLNEACKRSSKGYPTLLTLESRIQLQANPTCSGATTAGVRSQLSALERDTRLVTLTVGAANLGLSAVLAACSNPSTPEECQRQINRALALLRDCPEDKNSLDCSLTPLYAQVAREARGARIVVTGYPLLFESPPADDPRAAINQATTRLNSLIERAVTATQATYANIYYVDVTEEFARHGIGCGCTDPFINPPPPNALPTEAFHPTAEGYAAYANAIKTKLPDGWLPLI